jgi:hypothetical protein
MRGGTKIVAEFGRTFCYIQSHAVLFVLNLPKGGLRSLKIEHLAVGYQLSALGQMRRVNGHAARLPRTSLPRARTLV